jgi:isopentenyl diphosphate isomerase/L-lactate dehydrogenase-like FMN-dependent dehydrogenase
VSPRGVTAGADRTLRHDLAAAARLRSVEHAHQVARRRVPVPVADYVDGGAGNEQSLLANLSAVRSVQLRPRLGVTSADPPDLRTTVLGTDISMPLLLSPVGFTRMMHPAGDVAGATAAGAAGTIFTLSSMSGHTMDEVVAAAARPPWFQLYFLGGREGAEQLVARARQAGFAALVVTMDTQTTGDRRRERRFGLSPPLQLDRSTVSRMAPFAVARPRWLLDQARDGFHLELVNATGLGTDGGPMAPAEALLRWLASPPTWEDLGHLVELFDGPVLAKGILTADDARRALDAGASGIIVSNHGGRQLDGVASTFQALAEVVRAVGTKTEVLVDGGIRSGADVVRAVALGARAAMIGRAWAYGLCAAGQPGVLRVLSLLREDIDRTMRLIGAASVGEIDAALVDLPPAWPR